MIEIKSALLIIVFTIVSAAVCHMIARQRGLKPVFWGVMGALFGPFAIPFILLKKSRVNRD